MRRDKPGEEHQIVERPASLPKRPYAFLSARPAPVVHGVGLRSRLIRLLELPGGPNTRSRRPSPPSLLEALGAAQRSPVHDDGGGNVHGRSGHHPAHHRLHRQGGDSVHQSGSPWRSPGPSYWFWDPSGLPSGPPALLLTDGGPRGGSPSLEKQSESRSGGFAHVSSDRRPARTRSPRLREAARRRRNRQEDAAPSRLMPATTSPVDATAHVPRASLRLVGQSVDAVSAVSGNHRAVRPVGTVTYLLHDPG
jgi:hypothetical protein